MFVWYLLTGFLLSVIGAIPLGASNITVIITTAKESLTKGMQIAHGAGIGEVILVFFAVCYTQIILDFFNTNFWVQILFTSLFFVIGLILIFSNNINLKNNINFSINKWYSKIFAGILLAFVNPPVFIYWIIAISITQKYLHPISEMSQIFLLIFFLIGVYIGKVLTLYFYGKWSYRGIQKKTVTHLKLNQLIGIALIILSAFQGIRFIIS